MRLETLMNLCEDYGEDRLVVVELKVGALIQIVGNVRFEVTGVHIEGENGPDAVLVIELGAVQERLVS